MCLLKRLTLVAYAAATLLSASSVSSAGCSSCELQQKCEEFNNIVLLDGVPNMCDAEPQGTSSTRTWTDSSGSCKCDLKLESSHFLRNCAFTEK